MLKYCSIAFLSYVFFACGASDDEPNGYTNGPQDGGDQPINLIYDIKPDLLSRQDLGCTDKDAEIRLGNKMVWQWDGEDVHEAEYKFANGTSGLGLKNRIVDGVYYGLHVVEQYSCNRKSCPSEPSQRKIITAPKLLSVCRSGSYKRHSIESAALAMLAGVTTVRKYYDTLVGSKELATVRLNVLPQYETIEHHKDMKDKKNGTHISKTATDNAYWKFNQKGSKKEFFVEVLPHSKGFPLLGKNDVEVNFWEIPMALSHEYAHHVFFSHAPNLALLTAGLKLDSEGMHNGLWQPYGYEKNKSIPDIWTEEVKKNRMPSRLEKRLTTSVNRDKKLAVMVMPLVEGFADLFGFYSLGYEERAFKNIKCLEDNRDVNSERFADGSIKVLTLEVLQKYSSSNGLQLGKNCNQPSKENYYSLGSIFAHGVFRLIEDHVQTNSDFAGDLLLHWLEALEEDLASAKKRPAENYFYNAIALLLRTLSKADGAESVPLTFGQCEILEEVFPFIDKQNPDAGLRIDSSICHGKLSVQDRYSRL
ncbi:MAG: hypothetical protein R3B45_13170 [Bdellovibrionota bacterium]